jgi:hypothetical protein
MTYVMRRSVVLSQKCHPIQPLPMLQNALLIIVFQGLVSKVSDFLWGNVRP